MKVGVIGSGDVAKTLAAGFLRHGSARFGEIVVLSVKGVVALEALENAGADNLAGKIVVDTTNPLSDAPPVDGVLKFFTTLDESLMERLQQRFQGARFVKAFNSVGNPLMVNPELKGGKPSMFI